MLTPTILLHERISLVKRRDLPLAGEILVSVGDWVDGGQIVGRADRPGEVELLRLAELLSVDAYELLKYLKVRIGAKVEAGDVICRHPGIFGFFSKEILAPCSGTVEFFTELTGHLGIRSQSDPISMLGYLSGRVKDVVPGRSIAIESEAAMVQGIFGVGGERMGRILPLSISSDAEVDERVIPSDCHGAILVGGARPTLGALNLAASRGAVGVVVGSIDAATLRGFVGREIGVAITGDEEVPLSLVVTEGFGSLPISQRALQILCGCEGMPAVLNGTTQVRAGAIRPEVIVCYPENQWTGKSKSATDPRDAMTIGSRIRLIRYPFFGRSARVVSLPARLHTLATGADARVLECELDDGSKIIVPRANVELLN